MRFPAWLEYPYAEIGTPVVILLGFAVYLAGKKVITHRNPDERESYRKRNSLQTLVFIGTAAVLLLLWARTLQHTSTFLGLIGGGLAIAFREPLLAIAGRVAILGGHIYTVGDRVQVEQIVGDVIGVGFFYTRMMEVGNWIGGDQPSGRIVQFSNSKLFGSTAVFNYTRNFSYIWDEIILPITYSSNIRAGSDILVQVGGEYTRDFLGGARAELRKCGSISSSPVSS